MKIIVTKILAFAILAPTFLLAAGPGTATAQGLPKVNATICDTMRSENTMRVLYWNIQNGMWSEQGNNYDKFVEWVKSYDPDICVWCEASTTYKTGTTEGIVSGEGYLPDGWPELAARYGHQYTAIGGNWHFQAITSKYPIKTVLRMFETDVPGKQIAHGAALQSVQVGDREIYFVTLHSYPFNYGWQVKGEENRVASIAAHEGDYHRLHEIRYICSATVNNPEYSSQSDWVMLGDFNSISSYDNWHYGLPYDSPEFLEQDYIHVNTDLVDVIYGRFPGQFVASHIKGRRIDYVYVSESLYEIIDKALTVTDDWTFGYKLDGLYNFCYPSDHYPIMVDFRLK